jgi:glycosyltransferase involved in cell wall biosynthesis
MKLAGRRIVYLSYPRGPHHAHKLWAEVLVREFDGEVLRINPRDLFRLLRAKAQVVLAEGVRPTLTAWLYKKLRRVDAVVSIAIGYPLGVSKLGVKDKLLIRVLNDVDAVIAVSTLEKEFIRRKLGIARPSIYVCYPHVRVERFIEVKPCIVCRTACYVGALSYVKGADLLPEIFKHVKREVREFQLYVIGKGPLLHRLKQYSSKTRGFYVLGWLPHDVIKRVFSKCRVLMAPSRADTFGVPVLEGMAAGLVPVVTEMVGARDFVEKVNSNLIVPVDPISIAEKVIEVLNMDLEEIRRLSAKSKSVAMTWDTKKAEQAFNGTLKTILTNVMHRQ